MLILNACYALVVQLHAKAEYSGQAENGG
jgi:hypothetical protein